MMPTHKVPGGYQWGSKGKVYPDKASADKQGQAAYANGYKGGGKSKAYADGIRKGQ
jgi:hypothetical protein